MADTLAMPSSSAEKRVELLLQQLEQLPTLPAVAVHLLEATSAADHSDLKGVVGVLASDPSLSAQALQMCHRADLGVRGVVTTVEQAVRLLGFDELRRMVLAVSVFQIFKTDSDADAGPFNRHEFWRHSLAVACCAEALARASGAAVRVEPSDAFLAGLLHDIGKVALDVMLPKSYARVVEGVDLLRGNIADLERSVIGLDHLMVGKRLAERWGLPQPLREVIWLHGQRPTALPEAVVCPALVHVVSLADELVRAQHLGYSGNYVPSEPVVWAMALGLSNADLATVQNGLVESMLSHASAVGLDQVASSTVYVQALSRANQELNRVGQQLVSKNRKLAGRAKCFDVMSGFHNHLSPDASASRVLHAISVAAAAAIDTPAVAVFSSPPSVDWAEVCLPGDESAVVDFDDRSGVHAVAGSAVQSVDDGLEPVLAVASPALAGDRRFWIGLHADNHCIGGIVWGAAAGEADRLGAIAPELLALTQGWSLALRAAQIRDDGRRLAEQLADANRRLTGAETELLRARAMLTVGEMAAGAAHEMNNPLAVISGRSQLLASQLTDEKQKNAASLIFAQSQRLSDIITELMNFARPQPASPGAVALADVIAEAERLAKARSAPTDRTFERVLMSVPLVRVDRGQTAAAIAELIANAIEATDPATGRIELHAACDAVSGRVVLTITDNGCGMDEATLAHAFDPFFSAKPAGRRRGMGLPRAMRWLEASGGSVRLERRTPTGAVARVLLPAAVTTERSETGSLPVGVERKIAT